MHWTSRNRIRRSPLSIIALLFSLIGLVAAQSALAADQNTAYLPLKINAANSAQLAPQIDAALEGALADKNFTMLSRMSVEQLVDYNGSWPPPIAALTKVANATGLEVRVADEPLTCVARGTAVYLENLEVWKDTMESDEDQF